MAVAQDDARMQAHGQYAGKKRRTRGPPNDAHVHALRDLLVEQLQKRAVGDLHVIDQQMFFRACNELGELLACIDRADHQIAVPRLVETALGVALEELDGLADQLWLPGTHAEGAAERNIHVAEVKGEDVQLFAVNDEHLAVVAEQVVRSSGYSDSLFQHSGFKAAKG